MRKPPNRFPHPRSHSFLCLPVLVTPVRVSLRQAHARLIQQEVDFWVWGAKRTKGQRGHVEARALLLRGGGASPAAVERGTCQRESSSSSTAAACSQSGQDASSNQTAPDTSVPGSWFTPASTPGTAGPARSGCGGGGSGTGEAPPRAAESSTNSAAGNNPIRARTSSGSRGEAHGTCHRKTSTDPVPENRAFLRFDAPSGAQEAEEGSCRTKRGATTATAGDRSHFFPVGFRGNPTPPTGLGGATPRGDARDPSRAPSDWKLPEMGARGPPANTHLADREDCRRSPPDTTESLRVGDRLAGEPEAIKGAGNPFAVDETLWEEGRRSLQSLGAGQGWFWGGAS